MARTKPAAKAEQKPTPEKLKKKLAELKKSTVVGSVQQVERTNRPFVFQNPLFEKKVGIKKKWV